MIPPTTARLALVVAGLGSVWAVVREYLRYQESGAVSYGNLALAVVVPAAIYWVIRVNRE